MVSVAEKNYDYQTSIHRAHDDRGASTAVMTYYATVYLGEVSSASDSSASTGPGEPLYWVAPMDANYRRDKPGKSPMGMDLKASIEFINS